MRHFSIDNFHNAQNSVCVFARIVLCGPPLCVLVLTGSACFFRARATARIVRFSRAQANRRTQRHQRSKHTTNHTTHTHTNALFACAFESVCVMLPMCVIEVWVDLKWFLLSRSHTVLHGWAVVELNHATRLHVVTCDPTTRMFRYYYETILQMQVPFVVSIMQPTRWSHATIASIYCMWCRESVVPCTCPTFIEWIRTMVCRTGNIVSHVTYLCTEWRFRSLRVWFDEPDNARDHANNAISNNKISPTNNRYTVKQITNDQLELSLSAQTFDIL